MKRWDLDRRILEIAKARGLGVEWIEDARHTKVRIGNATQVLPRHREVNELTARAIIKDIEENA